jgi:hypothetical protein
MFYILITYNNHPKILCLENDKSLQRLRLRYNAQVVCKPPSDRTLQRWRSSNKARALCGCWISASRGARCDVHNRQSWLTVYYMKAGHKP